MHVLTDTNIRTLGPISELFYFDSQCTRLSAEMTALTAWNAMMSEPLPLLKFAFQIRDSIASVFDVKRIGGFSGKPVAAVNIGDYLDFFLVEYVDDKCLVLTERDNHLDVMTCIIVEGQTLTVASSVRVHNLFGRAYMIPVGIAHRWIVRSMFKRLRRLAVS
jgi:hypothetical protein